MEQGWKITMWKINPSTCSMQAAPPNSLAAVGPYLCCSLPSSGWEPGAWLVPWEATRPNLVPAMSSSSRLASLKCTVAAHRADAALPQSIRLIAFLRSYTGYSAPARCGISLYPTQKVPGSSVYSSLIQANLGPSPNTNVYLHSHGPGTLFSLCSHSTEQTEGHLWWGLLGPAAVKLIVAGCIWKLVFLVFSI